jgi:hypothetical protein
MDGIAKIAEEKGITEKEVIMQGLDEPEIAMAYGMAANAMEFLGAKKVMNTFSKEAFKNDLKRRALLTLESGITESATEGIQTVIEQVGAHVQAGKTVDEAWKLIDWAEVGEASAQGFVGGTGLGSTALLKGDEQKKKENAKDEGNIEKVNTPLATQEVVDDGKKLQDKKGDETTDKPSDPPSPNEETETKPTEEEVAEETPEDIEKKKKDPNLPEHYENGAVAHTDEQGLRVERHGFTFYIKSDENQGGQFGGGYQTLDEAKTAIRLANANPETRNADVNEVLDTAVADMEGRKNIDYGAAIPLGGNKGEGRIYVTANKDGTFNVSKPDSRTQDGNSKTWSVTRTEAKKIIKRALVKQDKAKELQAKKDALKAKKEGKKEVADTKEQPITPETKGEVDDEIVPPKGVIVDDGKYEDKGTQPTKETKPTKETEQTEEDPKVKKKREKKLAEAEKEVSDLESDEYPDIEIANAEEELANAKASLAALKKTPAYKKADKETKEEMAEDDEADISSAKYNLSEAKAMKSDLKRELAKAKRNVKKYAAPTTKEAGKKATTKEAGKRKPAEVKAKKARMTKDGDTYNYNTTFDDGTTGKQTFTVSKKKGDTVGGFQYDIKNDKGKVVATVGTKKEVSKAMMDLAMATTKPGKSNASVVQEYISKLKPVLKKILGNTALVNAILDKKAKAQNNTDSPSRENQVAYDKALEKMNALYDEAGIPVADRSMGETMAMSERPQVFSEQLAEKADKYTKAEENKAKNEAKAKEELDNYSKNDKSKEDTQDKLKTSEDPTSKEEEDQTRPKDDPFPERDMGKKGRKVAIKTAGEIIAKLSQLAKVKLNFRGNLGAGTLAYFRPSLREITSKFSNDIITATHEIGHAIHHRLSMTTGYLYDPKMKALLDSISNIGVGSEPNKNLSEKKKADYRRKENVAEFVRHFLTNEAAVKEAYPTFYEYFTAKLKEDGTLKEYRKVGESIRALFDAPAYKVMLANSTLGEANLKGFAKWRADREKRKGISGSGFTTTFANKLKYFIADDLAMFQKAVEFAKEQQGTDRLDVQSDPLVAVSLLSGINSKLDDMFENGLINFATKERLMFKVDGKELLMNFENLMSMFDQTSEKSWKDDKNMAVTWAEAQRTQEMLNRDLDELLEPELAALLKDGNGNYRIDEIATAADAKTPKQVVAAVLAVLNVQHLGAVALELEMSPKRILNKLSRAITTREGALKAGIAHGNGTDAAMAREAIKQVDDLHPERKKRLKNAISMYRQWADANMRYAVDGGRMSEESYQYIKERNQQYIAMNRVMDSETDQTWNDVTDGIKSESGFGANKNLTKAAKGSTKQRIDPYQSLISNTHKFTSQTDNNHAKRLFAQLLLPILNKDSDGKDTSNPDYFFEEGYDDNNIPTSAIIRPEGKETKGQNIIIIFHKGEPKRYSIPNRELYQAFKTINSEEDSAAFKALHTAKNIIQASIVNTPQFAIRNFLRDVQSRLVLSVGSRRQIEKWVKSGNTNKEQASRFKLYGGGQFGFFSQDAAKTLKGKKRFFSPSTWFEATGLETQMIRDLKAKNSLGRKALEKSRWFGNEALGGGLSRRGELQQRVIEFNKQYDLAIQDGMDEHSANMYAAYMSRELIDFARGGKTLKQMNRYIPFANAAYQGLYAAQRSAKKNPAGFMLRLGLVTVLPSMFEQLMLDDEDKLEYDNLAGYRKDFFYNFRNPFTDDGWIIIPKPFELGLLGSLVSRTFRATDVTGGGEHVDYHAFDGYLRSVRNSMLPVVSEPENLLGGIKPIIEVLFNFDMFRQRYIVPTHEVGTVMRERTGMEDASVPAQWLSREPVVLMNNIGLYVSASPGLGRYLGWTKQTPYADPRSIDHIVKGFTGYYGRMGYDIIDYATKQPSQNKQWWESVVQTMTSLGKDKSIAGARDIQRIYELSAQSPKLLREIPEHGEMLEGLKEIIGYYSMHPEKSLGQELSKEDKKALGNSILQYAKSMRSLSEAINIAGAKLDRDQYDEVHQLYIDMRALAKFNR